MIVLVKLQMQMTLLFNQWEASEAELRDAGFNSLSDVIQTDVLNIIVKLYAIASKTRSAANKNASLDAAMQEAIDLVKDQLDVVQGLISTYNGLYMLLYQTLWFHNVQHLSPSETPHKPPGYRNWKYDDDFPKFPCPGDCGEVFDTPGSPHSKRCGVNDDTSVMGCGKKYMTCIKKDAERHSVVYCGRSISLRQFNGHSNKVKNLGICGAGYRKCTDSSGVHAYFYTYTILSNYRFYASGVTAGQPTKHGEGTDTPPTGKIEPVDTTPNCVTCYDGSNNCPNASAH